MSVSEQKNALRGLLIQWRRDMPRQEKRVRDDRIFMRLLPLLEECGGVFTYVSTETEVDTRRLLEWCFENGKPVFAPVSGDTELTFYQVRGSDELKHGRFGISEPVNRDNPAAADSNSLCVVPALCCDRQGFRLGYGRGYYDRFLEGFPGRSVIICYSDFVMEIPREPHDRRADLVITD